MEWPEAFPNQFHSVNTAADLAAAIHKAALDECPESDYAKNYRNTYCQRPSTPKCLVTALTQKHFARHKSAVALLSDYEEGKSLPG
jgi:hypothetical protein